MGIDSLLAGIIVNTGLYSINIAVMGNSSLLNLNKTETVFTKMKDVLMDTPFKSMYTLAVVLVAVILVPLFVMSKKISKKEKITKMIALFIFLTAFNMNIPNFIWHGFHFPNSLPCL